MQDESSRHDPTANTQDVKLKAVLWRHAVTFTSCEAQSIITQENIINLLFDGLHWFTKLRGGSPVYCNFEAWELEPKQRKRESIHMVKLNA
jgi:hypothetical protein